MRVMLLIAFALLIAGCGSTKESGTEKQGGSEDAIRAFEAGFQPSDHDPLKQRLHDRIPRRNDSTATNLADEALTPASTEMTQGFRVQVFSSTDIDAARAKKTEFEAAFPGEWFYLDYHAPSYKLRVGNFLTRFEAERFARTLTDQGHTEAWTVPERVFSAPGKRKAVPPPTPPQEPQK